MVTSTDELQTVEDEVLKATRENIHTGSDVIKLMGTGGAMTHWVDPEDAHYTEKELVQEGLVSIKPTPPTLRGFPGILIVVRAGIDSIED